MQELQDKFENSIKLFNQMGLSEEDVLVYLYIYHYDPKDLDTLQKELQIPKKKVIKSIKSLQEKQLLEPDPTKPLQYKIFPPYILLTKQLHFILQTVKQLQKSLPKTLKQQLKSLEQEENTHKQIEQYHRYLDDTKQTLPAQIKKHYQRYHEILKTSEIFDKIETSIQNLKDILPQTTSKITEDLRSPDSFLKKIEQKLSKTIEDEFKLGISGMVAKIFYEFINEHLGEITKKYVERFTSIIHEFSSEILPELKDLSDAVKEVSTDIDIAFMAMETGTKALIGDLEARLDQIHKNVDEKVLDLGKRFDHALSKSFDEGILKEFLEFIELAEGSLQEFSFEFLK